MIAMTMQELKCSAWERIDEEQKARIVSACNKHGMKGIYDEITTICKTLALLTGLQQSEVFKAFESQNILFYHQLQMFQREFMLYGVADLTPVLSYLVVPEILQKSKAVECLKLFFSLSIDEKDNVIEGLRLYASLEN